MDDILIGHLRYISELADKMADTSEKRGEKKKLSFPTDAMERQRVDDLSLITDCYSFLKKNTVLFCEDLEFRNNIMKRLRDRLNVKGE